ncbi:hypothetical protein BU24DRAFT_422046 [Aaosphaeria arxii CBS 175.79]|uniref:Uncharacterized protein n=1 Tax=Aaosphaeria arxii CBS 175.79 TaxID=1450172 RepID=A0A6A5XU15_9PLEO|nr:uncharacterized protein BU24DRAFT_422046 [Aaosphaeria arxii CBS 175.79]KAF2015734.1 hypothetical protein BU24DRAFT_422046 [Aaosphaeria arxii CBS 175.79]
MTTEQSAPETVPDQKKIAKLDEPVPDTFNQLLPLPEGWKKDNKHPKFQHCQPPKPPVYPKGMQSVFLAGSIEMGKAIQWQERLVEHLQHLPLTVCNPRRGSWTIDGTPAEMKKAFDEQVKWELEALENCDVICFFFDHATISPVTLVELGLWAKSGKVVVCCSKKYWRASNVHFVCDRYKVPITDTFENLLPLVKHKLQEKGMKFPDSEDVRIPPTVSDLSAQPTKWKFERDE